ncbi:helix-turn-helix transcriptional regulator [Aeromonas veronii]|jgi:prophage regulatory protein|uniref:helix-turn-helix transcriptional regulator n=1 Tax=Aeromonas veronii TaxID=654 RepID=UPI003D20CE02
MELMKLTDVIRETRLSRATIYRLIAKGDFPKQIHLSERATAWLRNEVMDWIKQMADAR